jgi:hypothetical protein
VQHDGPVLLPVLGHVGRAKPFGQLEVGLEGAALPFPPDGVGQLEVELRPVEGAFARVDLVVVPDGEDRLSSAASALSHCASVPMRTSGRVDSLMSNLAKPVSVDGGQEPDELRAFLGDLVLGAEDVGVVLGEAADAHEAVERAMRLVAVAGAELGEPQREVAVGLDALVEHLHVAGAVHGLERIDPLFVGMFLVDLGDEHVLAVLVPVARGLPELAVHDLRGADFLVSGGT